MGLADMLVDALNYVTQEGSPSLSDRAIECLSRIARKQEGLSVLLNGKDDSRIIPCFCDILRENRREEASLRVIEEIENILDYRQQHLQLGTETIAQLNQQTRQQAAMNSSREIFISYAWGGESEELVDRLDTVFQEKGILIVRDKRDAGYRASIMEFMRRIGRGKAVIAVISNRYLESKNCMFELIEIAKNGDFRDRIFPIVLKDANIYKPVPRLRYIKYWEEQIQELDAALKEVSAANLQGFREAIDLYTQIRNTIAGLVDTLSDMNTLTPQIHSESNFKELLNAISQVIEIL